MKFNRELKTTFGAISKSYDQYRPSYPKEVIDYIIKETKITKESKILEVGCGSGIATVLFAEKGFQIVALDISKELISIAKVKTKGLNVKYIISSFEDIKLPKDNFDIILSAQAFHWIEPSIGYQKVYELLKENGKFAFFWYFPDFNKSELFLEIKELFVKYCPDFPEDYGETKKLEAAAKYGNKFNIEVKRYFEEREFNKEHYFNLLLTSSWVSSLDNQKKNELSNEIRESVKEENFKLPYKNVIIIGSKRFL